MRTFIFLFCTTIFGFSPASVFSQNAKIVIPADKMVTVDEVFDIIKQQTNYTFIYQEDLFKELPKVQLKKGTIKIGELLKSSFSTKDFDYSFTNNNTIVVKQVKTTGISEQSKLIEIKGVVTNEKKEPLPGVNIIVKETKLAVQTDFDGKYTITAPNDGTLLFTYIGYKAEIIEIKSRKVINITLKEETRELTGVTINTGVTVRKKELITGAVTTFRGEELRQVSTQNAVQALKSLDPSFIVVNNNLVGSNPNVLPTIEVRGQTSIAANQVESQFKDDPNQPLFILDGFPTTLQQVVDLDINRIANITLLKDAASTALYGARSANGVVVIETIKPTQGKLQVSYVYNSAYEIADLSVYNLMNAEQKLEFERLSGAYDQDINVSVATQYNWDQLYNKRLADVRRGVNTYWLKEPIQMGITSGHSLNLGGGSEEFRFNIAGNYKSLTGTMKGSEHDTWGYNAGLVYKKNKLSINNTFFVSGGTNQESPYGSFSIWANTSPYYPKYNENGVITRYLDGTSLPRLATSTEVGNQAANPLYNVFLPSYNKGNNFNFTNNFAVNYDVSPHIKTTGAISVSKIDRNNTVFVSPDDTRFVNNIFTEKGTYTRQETRTDKWNANIGGTYSNVFNKVHSFNYTIRASALETRNNSYTSALRGFPTGVLGNPAFAFGYEPGAKPAIYTELTRNIDLTNQINYAYDRRFLFDFTQTIAGATNFGTNKKYSPYWGVGFGWNLNNEFKMNADIVNILKVRANIGQTGNQNLVGYASYDVYNYNANTNIFGTGLNILQVANPNLEAQRTKDLSVGLDLAMFKNKLTATIGAYRRKTSPQIVSIDLASSTGIDNYPLNVGYLTTEGLELKMNYNFVFDAKRNFIWGLGLMATSNNNKLGGFNNALSSLNDAAQKTASLTRYYDGASINDLWAVPSLGIDPATGQEVFLKKNGQTTFIFDKKDEVVMGNSREKATGVASTNLTYKGFSFGLFVRYSFGADRFNTALYNKVENISSKSGSGSAGYIFDNQDARALTDRWTTPGQMAEFKAISLTGSTPISSRFIQKDNYISGESVRLGYRLTDREWLKRNGLTGLGINVLANEFFRISTIKAERGIDYPFSRTYSLSLNLSI